tara:strand:- start:5 stop:130 length:126 start_codon:yes stop_codon:yes gene_type:complete
MLPLENSRERENDFRIEWENERPSELFEIFMKQDQNLEWCD